MKGTYETVRSIRPGRSVFNLSYEKKLTCDMGQLIPIMADEMVPGDTFKIGVEAVVRFQPLVAPVLHVINAFFHYFFVPYRLLDAAWEDFITGGADGQDASSLQRWAPSGTGPGTIWDYFGFPDVALGGGGLTNSRPLLFPLAAYNKVYNEYYRDETLIAEVALDEDSQVWLRSWRKDYFTSALPWQQRGTAPALPISGSAQAVFDIAGWATNASAFDAVKINSNPSDNKIYTTNADSGENMRQALSDNNTVDLSSATTFDVADLRLAFQIQKWMERNARAGARYTEFLQAHFGVSPRDDRLQRAQYIGGAKFPVQVSEVLQTSSTDGTSAQGNMAGHGLSAGAGFCASYTAQEFGVVIGIMSVMPEAVYQQGINRQWLRRTRFDFYSPEFAHLSEQAVLREELFASAVQAENDTIFGYQGRFNEMRSKQNMVCGLMRSDAAGSLDFWHLARDFATAPSLNQAFIECDGTAADMKRIFAAPSEPGLIVNVANIIKAIRPLPIEAEPGLIDHS